MSEKYSWADQWFKAQQQFVDAWTDMAKSASVDKSSQTDLWSRGFDMWRQALGGQGQPDAELAMRKCMDMGREYFAMAEQVGKGIADGGKPTEAINQWLEQLKQALQQFSGMPSFNGANVNDFMKQWFTPTQSWQQMVAALAPMQQATWQMPGMNTSVFIVDVAVFIDACSRCFVGQVRRAECRVKKKRAALVPLLDQPYRLICLQMGCITSFPQRFTISMPVQATTMHVIPVTHTTGEVTVNFFKASRHGQHG